MNVILISILLMSSTAEAEDKLDLRIVELDEGVVAPFSGLLLTSDLLTKIEVTSEKKLEELKIEHDYSILMNDALLQSITDRYNIENDFLKKRIEVKDKYIKELESSGDSWLEYRFIGGLVLGCAATIAIAYSLEGAYK